MLWSGCRGKRGAHRQQVGGQPAARYLQPRELGREKAAGSLGILLLALCEQQVQFTVASSAVVEHLAIEAWAVEARARDQLAVRVRVKEVQQLKQDSFCQLQLGAAVAERCLGRKAQRF